MAISTYVSIFWFWYFFSRAFLILWMFLLRVFYSYFIYAVSFVFKLWIIKIFLDKFFCCYFFPLTFFWSFYFSLLNLVYFSLWNVFLIFWVTIGCLFLLKNNGLKWWLKLCAWAGLGDWWFFLPMIWPRIWPFLVEILTIGN